MTGLEGITQRITEDAKQRAAEIISASKAEADRIKAEADERITAEGAKTKAEAEENAKAGARRIISAAQLDGKKELLRAKQEVINNAFTNAVAQLASLDDNEYDGLIKQMSERTGGEITLVPRDKAKGTGGGFKAKNGAVEYNFSFEALAKNARERLEKELVAVLFD